MSWEDRLGPVFPHPTLGIVTYGTDKLVMMRASVCVRLLGSIKQARMRFGQGVLLLHMLLALMAGSAACNLYAQDGTALWMTLLTGSERVDLRARQWAYLVTFTPITIVIAVVSTIWSGLAWAWPWVLALTPALLGGGSGLGNAIG